MPAAPFFVAYTGFSMNPTLVEPELLEVMPPGEAPLRPGDVLLFRRPGDPANLVHRIQQVTAAGLVTRGDNTDQDDEGWCMPADIHGQVVAAWRGQQRRVIHGGRSGQMWGALMHGWRFAKVHLLAWAERPYQALARMALVRRLAPAALRPRVLVFQNGETQTFQLVLGPRVIGYYDPTNRVWHIPFPYRLLVDETALPSPRPK